MIDKVQKIREELARQKEETSIGLSEHENGVEQGRMEIINALSIFLDSLQEEPVSEDLDIAIGEYCSNPDNFITYIDVAFAYRSEQKDDIPLIIKAIKFGANWQKEQMMTKAVDAKITLLDGISYVNKDVLSQFKQGDKVKVIVIKED